MRPAAMIRDTPIRSVEDLVEGQRYYITFSIPTDRDPPKLASGSFRARFSHLGLESNKQLFAYFQSGDYLDVRHIVAITEAPEV